MKVYVGSTQYLKRGLKHKIMGQSSLYLTKQIKGHNTAKTSHTKVPFLIYVHLLDIRVIKLSKFTQDLHVEVKEELKTHNSGTI